MSTYRVQIRTDLSSLRYLYLSECMFYSLPHLEMFISGAPALTDLVLNNVQCRCPGVPAEFVNAECDQLTLLKKLSFRGVRSLDHLNSFLSWIRRSSSLKSLQSIDIIAPDNMNWYSELKEIVYAAKNTLQHLGVYTPNPDFEMDIPQDAHISSRIFYLDDLGKSEALTVISEGSWEDETYRNLVAISPSGRLCAQYSRALNSVRLVNSANLAIMHEFVIGTFDDSGPQLFDIWFSPDSRYLVMQRSHPSCTEVWNIRERRTLFRLAKERQGTPMAWSRDGSTIVFGVKNGKTEVFPVNNPVNAIILHDVTATSQVVLVSISEDAFFVATADDEGVVRVWDVLQRKRIRRYARDRTLVKLMAFAPNSSALLCCQTDGKIRRFEFTTMAPPVTYYVDGWRAGSNMNPTRDIISMAMTDDGQWIAYASSSGFIKIRDAKTGGSKIRFMLANRSQGAVRDIYISRTEQTLRLLVRRASAVQHGADPTYARESCQLYIVRAL